MPASVDPKNLKNEAGSGSKPSQTRRARVLSKGNAPDLDKRELLAALRALKRGEFDVRLPDGLDGIDGQICETFNEFSGQLDSLGQELKDVRQAVGREGRTKRRARRHGLQGGFGQYVSTFNDLLDDVTAHMDEMARVVVAVGHGDLTASMDEYGLEIPLTGEFLRHAKAVNGVVSRLRVLGTELTRVAREVGIEGKLGAQADVPGVSGAWRELSEGVNLMALNLTSQVREIARVTTAVAQGDLTKTVNVEVRGELLALKDTINTMVHQLSSFTDEVTRVAREVGTEGKLGGQAQVHGVSGVWRELTENVNSMANNLTLQVRNIAEVSTAIADGNLSKKITVEVQGELLELKNTINTMVDQLSSFADEVTRVAREVGSEGILGATAEVAGVSGVWQELTLNVNGMATNLTNQVRNISEVTTAIARGDLGKKITVDAKGEILQLKSTINSTVDKLNHFSNEVTRVARLVGTEGTLGVQASVADVSGIWRELTDNVNLMADNLTNQVRSIAEVTTAVANGDLSKKITVEVKGEISELKNTINQMVDSLNFFAREVTRLAREVGTEGTLGGQAQVHNMSGMWLELTSNVNSMASNLTSQVRNISEVASAVARGDLSRKITVDARGEVLDLKVTLNDMVDQLNALGAEVTRVAREVGVEGKLGGQALVIGGRGVWKELTDNVNLMASNLTNQVRDIAEVTTSVARGNLTRKIVVDARGEILELKNTVNTMVDQLSSFAAEVTRLASDVGVEGKLGGQADVRGVSGTWRDLTDAVNSMASNLTAQVRSISEVATAIAEGDLKRKIAVDARGEILELKETINTMVDQLSGFAEEVSRVAREVGTEGTLGGQASVEGVRGTWKELTENVNSMASNITNQVRDIANVATAIAGGDLSQKITVQVAGELAEVKSVFNTMVDQLSNFADQVTRLAREVGVEGVLGGQAEVRGVSGIWKELTDNVNLMAENLTNQVRDIAHVTTAVATGDLSKKIKVEVKGELLELKNTVNTMVEQLSSFADEVTRVAREVGTEGTLGGQAQVKGVSGTWRELTDNVNLMAENITEQVRGIARVVTAVARGDLKQELRLESKGEIATLVLTINNMIVTLSTFADQVTGVARDVGVEGRLGGQADVPGAAGVWRDLTNNVNELAGNLTRQVRAIGDVATAVTEGDLTQTIAVEARGEVALLKDNLNEMISVLAKTTKLNEEQDWLKSNLARFSRILQGQRDLITVADRVLSELSQVVESQHGAFYMARVDDGDFYLELFASYAFTSRKTLASRYALGESMVGQAAREKKRILVTEVPSDYVQISSALGQSPPLNLVIVPILFEGAVKGVIELASFHRYTKIQLDFIDQLLESLGIVVATIEATMRTDDLLRQSQSMGEELQTQQEELQQTNEELEEKARQLTTQRDEVERKNQEVGLAKLELEEKAEQLALTSKYKSQFLANMSHELRTPLNSLLILSRQLAENGEGNLSPKQVEYASTVYQAGADLLSLINEILDLAKVESGTMAVEPSEVRLSHLQDYLDRSFRSMAEEKGLKFVLETKDDLPSTITTDDMRLKQVLRNLLSNAIKFTEAGEVRVVIASPVHARTGSDKFITFAVSDTGIGIEDKKQGVVFEAFQQADGSTSRRYGGTGLGLSISREIAYLLGGQLTLKSVLGEGSTFTLTLPRQYQSKVESTPPPPQAIDQSASSLEAEGTGALTLRRRTAILSAGALDDDRTNVHAGDRVLLIIEDDQSFAEILLNLARERDFKAIVALTGHEGFELAKHHNPDSICLDLMLPDMDGWVLLDRLKHDSATRHIPVHIISAATNERRAYECGAVAVIEKPVDKEAIDAVFIEMQALLDKRIKHVLLVEDDANQRMAIIELIGDDDVNIQAVSNGESALAELEKNKFDCMVLDLSLPGMDGLELIQALREKPALRRLPVIVYTGKELSKDERNGLSRLAETVIVKDVRSPDRLIEETALFLHRAESRMPAEKRQILRSLVHGDPALEGKTVLVVDDDVRNLYAITAVLEQHSMKVLHAENGFEAIKAVEENPDLHVVLMDIMMPEMDGFEAMRRIRKNPTKKRLPIIALTAKAMKGDREKCIEAGASDYVTKPVDPDQLISLLRVWLYT